MRKLCGALALFGVLVMSLGVMSAPAAATLPKLEHSAVLSADCGQATITLKNNSNFTFGWNVQTNDGQNFNVPVPAGETVEVVVDLEPGVGGGWISYGTVSGPESDWYLTNKTLAVLLCEPEPEPSPSAVPTPTAPATTAPPSTEEPEAECVDINTGTFEELLLLKHVDEARAEQIMALRPFVSLNDLERVDGFVVGGSNLAELIAGGGEHAVPCAIEPPENVGQELPLTSAPSWLVFVGAGAVLLAAGAALVVGSRVRRKRQTTG